MIVGIVSNLTTIFYSSIIKINKTSKIIKLILFAVFQLESEIAWAAMLNRLFRILKSVLFEI